MFSRDRERSQEKGHELLSRGAQAEKFQEGKRLFANHTVGAYHGSTSTTNQVGPRYSHEVRDGVCTGVVAKSSIFGSLNQVFEVWCSRHAHSSIASYIL